MRYLLAATVGLFGITVLFGQDEINKNPVLEDKNFGFIERVIQLEKNVEQEICFGEKWNKKCETIEYLGKNLTFTHTLKIRDNYHIDNDEIILATDKAGLNYSIFPGKMIVDENNGKEFLKVRTKFPRYK